PDCQVADEYGAEHRLWRISDPETVARIQALMSDKKLVIADGHHRYETALAFRNENPKSADASKVVMTFVNMHSPGLKILATHRLISDLKNFDETGFINRAESAFHVERIDSIERLTERWKDAKTGDCVFGIAMPGGLYLFTAKKPEGQLDVA